MTLYVNPGVFLSHFSDVNFGSVDAPVDIDSAVPVPWFHNVFGLVGLHISALAHYPVYPVLGVVWLVNDRITVYGVPPEPRLIYKVNDHFNVFVGGELLGEAYKTSLPQRSSPAGPTFQRRGARLQREPRGQRRDVQFQQGREPRLQRGVQRDARFRLLPAERVEAVYCPIPRRTPSWSSARSSRGFVMNILRLLVCSSTLVLCTTAGLRAGPLLSDKDAGTNRSSPCKTGTTVFTFAYETSINLGIDNPNNYIINPQIFEVRWRPFHAKPVLQHAVRVRPAVRVRGGGGRLPARAGAPLFRAGASGRVGSTRNLAATGRFSSTDGFTRGSSIPSGPPHGQGQDLTFMPTVTGGVLYAVSPRQKIGLSLFYEHFSNAGMSEPEAHNVGLNSVGPLIEYNVLVLEAARDLLWNGRIVSLPP